LEEFLIGNIENVSSALFSVTSILVTVYIGFIGLIALFNASKIKILLRGIVIFFFLTQIGIIAATAYNCAYSIIMRGFSGWLMFF